MADYLLVDTTGFDVDTEAKPALFSNESDVMAKIAKFKEAATGIKKAALSGDEGSYGKAIGALGGGCKSCHDDYKE